MIHSSKPRPTAFSRSLIAAALTLGVAGTAMIAAPAQAAKPPKPEAPKLSPEFQKLAAPFSQALEAAKKKPDVIAAKGNQAALATALAGEKAQIDGLFAAATSADDKLVAGQLAVGLGSLAEDPAIQRRGITAMIDSGKSAPADLPKLNFFAGQLAYVAKDYPAARVGLQAAVTGGYHENDADALLAEAYMADNQIAQGLTVLQQAIDQKKGTGVAVPESWYRRGLGAAYKAKALPQAAGFAMGLARDYPTTANWGGAIIVVREIGRYPAQETLDLMRLMARTNSYTEGRDYVEYIQAADPRRLPGESLKVIEAGLSAGKLQAGDPFVTEGRSIASGRIAADKASLPSLERDARAGSASGATVAGAADAFLSYDDPAKAEALYTVAQGKPGVDQAQVLTRLGIAQVDQGKFAEAQATFAKVDGTRKPIAQLWGIYAAQKAGGGAKPAAR